MPASRRCRRPSTRWSLRPKQIKEKGIVEYPIGLPLSPTEGASTSWYLLTKAFGGELFDKDFNPLFARRTRPATRRWPLRCSCSRTGWSIRRRRASRDSQINEGLFAKGLTSIMISGEPGGLASMNDPAQSQVAGQVAAILGADRQRQDAQLRAARRRSAVPKVSQNKEAAIEFVKWFTSKESQIDELRERRPADAHLRAGRAQRGRQADQRRRAGRSSRRTSKHCSRKGRPTWYPQFSSAVNTGINSAPRARSRSTRRCRTSPSSHQAGNERNDGSRRHRRNRKAQRRRLQRRRDDSASCWCRRSVLTMAALVFYPLVQTGLGQPAPGQSDAGWNAVCRAQELHVACFAMGVRKGLGQHASGMSRIAVVAETVFGVLAAALINQVKLRPRMGACGGCFAVGAARRREWCHLAVDLSPGRRACLNGILAACGLPFENHVWFNDAPAPIAAVTVVHVWRMMPLTIVIVLAAMQSIPGHLYEAARIDGAGALPHVPLHHVAADRAVQSRSR